MAGELEVSTEGVAKAATRSEEVRDGLDAVLTTLRDALDGHGNAWGNDSYGAQFANGGSGYSAQQENQLDGAEAMIKNFRTFFDKQAQSGRLLSDQEQINVAGFATE